MEASPKSLSEVLRSAKRFVIPEYQRPFIWTKEEVEQLWNDLLGAYSDFHEDNNDPDVDTYFLGPIVVANRKDENGAKISNIVDGQQRLTTLHTLLWIARNCFKALTTATATEKIDELDRVLTMTNRMPSLSVAGRDQSNFQAIRENTVLDETRELGVAAKYLRNQIQPLQEEKLLGMSNYVLNMTKLILVQTDSFSSAWELFIGLNGKGKPLNPADLIKAYVCGTTDDSQAMADIWEDKVVPLENDATSAILDLVRVATGEKGSDAKLFKLFEKAWNGKAVTSTLLDQGCQAYFRFWHQPLDNFSNLGTTVSRPLRSLRALRRRDVTPVLIALASRFGYDAILDANLLSALDAYQLWMAICGKRGRERNFSKLAHSIYKEQWDHQTSLQKIREELEKLAPSKEHVYEAIKNSAYRGRVMLHIVKSYEEGLRGDVRIDDVWYEHIMPQTGTDYWYGIAGTTDTNAYARVVNNIGNIAPLDPTTNIKGQNDPWDIKRKLFMKEVQNWLVAQIARENPEDWTPNKIKERAKSIAEWSVKTRWPLLNRLTQLDHERPENILSEGE